MRLASMVAQQHAGIKKTLDGLPEVEILRQSETRVGAL